VCLSSHVDNLASLYEKMQFTPITPNEMCEPRVFFYFKSYERMGRKAYEPPPRGSAFEKFPNTELFAVSVNYFTENGKVCC
jgi:hypothetical protein